MEVLDGEQNSKFRDHYVEIPLDLSEVLFIATANDLQTIPRPLLDRMEIIEINSYTENEKEHIAKEHLIPKQIRNHGLKEQQLSIDDEALREMITGYTKEAGVRNLERKIGEICRKTARKILEEKQETVKVTRENLEEFLGRAKFTYQKRNQCDEIGIVRGLAWTSVGGDTLQIEVNLMPGKGEFLLTGQLGDVMKESARRELVTSGLWQKPIILKVNFSRSMTCTFISQKGLCQRMDHLRESPWQQLCFPLLRKFR